MGRTMSTSARTVSASATSRRSTGTSARRSSTSMPCRATRRVIAAHGALVADTGAHTGRSPKDKFVVRDANTEGLVWWDNNDAMSVEHFDVLLADFIAHAKGKTLFAQDLYGGADPGLRMRARVFTEYAWHSLFIRNLLIRPAIEELANFVAGADDRRPALVPRRSQTARGAKRDDHRLRLLAQDRAHRRHELCGRDEEIRVHRPQLSAAGETGHADALLGQHRQGRRRRRSSSASPAPARRRSPPIRTAR